MVKLNSYGVSEVISVVLSLAIVLAAVSSILAWGLPHVERIQMDASLENTYTQMSIVADSIEDMIHRESGGANRTFPFSLREGSLNINGTGDRFIIAYSRDLDYDFNITGLNDSDNSFIVNISQCQDFPIDQFNFSANIYRFEGDPVLVLPAYEAYTITDQSGNSNINFQFNLTPLLTIAESHSITLVSARLQLTPICRSVSDEELKYITLYHHQNDRWIQTNDIGYIYPTSEGIESNNLINLLSTDYQARNNFCSFRIEDPDYPLNTPAISKCIDTLTLGSLFDHIQFNTRSYTPTLVINYIDWNQINKPIISPTNDCSCIPSKTPIVGVANDIINNRYSLVYQGKHINVRFKERSTPANENLVTISNKNHIVSFSPDDNLQFYPNNKEQDPTNIMEKTSSKATQDKNSITYLNQYGPGIDLRYMITNDMIKEELIIKDRNCLPKLATHQDGDLLLVHHMQANDKDTAESMGLCFKENQTIIKDYAIDKNTQVTTYGAISLIDNNKTSIFTLPKIYAWDSSNRQDQIQLKRTIIMKSDGSIVIWIRTPWSWLSDKERVFPVYIDDTLTRDANDYPGDFKPYYNLQGTDPPFDPLFFFPGSNYREYGNFQRQYIQDYDEFPLELRNTWSSVNPFHVNLWYYISLSDPIDKGYRDEFLDTIEKIVFNWTGCFVSAMWPPPEFNLSAWNGAWQVRATESAKKGAVDEDYGFTISGGSTLSPYIYWEQLGAQEQPWINISYCTNHQGNTFEDYVKLDIHYKDARAPIATIDTGPCGGDVGGGPSYGGALNQTSVTFTWHGYDWDETPVEDLQYSHRLLGYVDTWSAWSYQNITTYHDLPDGNYTFQANVKDEIGLRDATPAQCSFDIIEGYTDNESLDTTSGITALPPPPAPNTAYRLTFTDDLKGTLRIDLLDDDYVFGRIFLFDLGFLEYRLPSQFGVNQYIFEGTGILSRTFKEESMKQEPIFYSDDDQIALRILQINTTGASAGGIGRFRLHVQLVENYVREFLETTYQMKMQVFGKYSENWIDYLTNVHNFTQSLSYPDTYYSPTFNDPLGTLTTISHSLCKIEIT